MKGVLGGGPASPRGGDAGFTLVEMMVALLLIGGALLMVVTAATAAFGYQQVARERLLATGVANRVMEQIRTLPFESVKQGLDPTSVTASSLGSATSSACGSIAVAPASEALVKTSGALPAVGLRPNSGSTTVSAIAFVWSTFVSRAAPTVASPLGDPLRVTVCVKWSHAGQAQATILQTFIWQPASAGPYTGSFLSGPWAVGEASVPEGSVTIEYWSSSQSDATLASASQPDPSQRFVFGITGARARGSFDQEVRMESSVTLPTNSGTFWTSATGACTSTSAECFLKDSVLEAAAGTDSTAGTDAVTACGTDCLAFAASASFGSASKWDTQFREIPATDLAVESRVGSSSCTVLPPLQSSGDSPCAVAVSTRGSTSAFNGLTASLNFQSPYTYSLTALQFTPIRFGAGVIESPNGEVEPVAARQFTQIGILALGGSWLTTFKYADEVSISGRNGVPPPTISWETKSYANGSTCSSTLSATPVTTTTSSSSSAQPYCWQYGTLSSGYQFSGSISWTAASAFASAAGTSPTLAQVDGPTISVTLRAVACRSDCVPGQGNDPDAFLGTYRITLNLGAISASFRWME